MHIATAFLLAQLRIAGPPIASIGAVDGDTLHMLSEVMLATEDSRGNLYVLQRFVPYVAVFDSLGRRIATLGRSGRGPGEFVLPANISLADDSVWVTDVQLNRFSLFAPDFTHVRDVIVGEAFEGLRTVLDGPQGIVASSANAVGFTAELRSRSLNVHVFQSWSGAVSELARFRPDDRVKVVVVGERATSVIPPIVNVPFVVAGGDAVFLVEREPRLALTKLTQNGVSLSRTEIPLRKERVPESFEEEFIERVLRGLPSGSDRRLRQALDDAIDLPANSYFIISGRVHADGRLWLTQSLPDQSPRFHKIAADASVEQTLVLPERDIAAMSISNRHVWVLTTDDLDVPFLMKYRLTSRSRQ